LNAGSSPQLPETGWKVLYSDALTSWIQGAPSLLLVGPVTEWIHAVEVTGPPVDGVRAVDDLFIAPVGDTKITVSYIVIEYEFLVILKQIR
jgi:hypothetical protein